MTQPTRTSRIPRTGFFVNADDATMDALEDLATTRNLIAGEVLFEQGDEGDTFYFIEEGVLEVSVLSSEGRKLYLELMNAGEFLGEIALLDPGPRTATISAREPTRLMCIARTDLVNACLATPELGLGVAMIAAQRLREISQKLHEQVFLPLPARLARKLIHFARHGETTVRLSQSDLAEFIGATREAVSKTLKQWEQTGIISIGRQKVIIEDLDALNALSDVDLI